MVWIVGLASSWCFAEFAGFLGLVLGIISVWVIWQWSTSLLVCAFTWWVGSLLLCLVLRLLLVERPMVFCWFTLGCYCGGGLLFCLWVADCVYCWVVELFVGFLPCSGGLGSLGFGLVCFALVYVWV